MLHKEIPFLRICLSFCAGIISGLYINTGTLLLIFTGIIIVSLFVLSLFYNRYEANSVFGYSMTIALFICGLQFYKNEKKSITVLEPEMTLLAGTVSDYPTEKPKSYLISFKLISKITSGGSEPLKGSILLYYKKDFISPPFLPGDMLIVRCRPSEISARGNPCEFNYRFYMENHGIRYYSLISKQHILCHSIPQHRKIIHKALIFRQKIIGMYEERGITGNRLALLAAITLGQKNMLDAGQKEYFIKAGVMHIMAVSGLHTLILSLFVFNLLFFLKGRYNIMRILITLSLLWAFAFVTGLTPSVLRATMMFSFLQTGKILKRPANGINSVLASAFALMIFRPSVIFDSGFLLSYSAVIYIIIFYKYLYNTLVFKSVIADKIWQSAVVTIVAQAGTMPLTILLFNRFPTYFILTNIIIVPLTSLLVITGILIPILFPVKVLSHFLAVILNNLIGLTEFVTRQTSSLPFASIQNIGMTIIGCILLTHVIFLFSFSLLNKKSLSLLYPFTALLIYLLSGTLRELSIRTTGDIIVYNTPGYSTIGIRTGKILNIYTDKDAPGNEVKRHCASLGLGLKVKKTKSKTAFILAGKTRILITDGLNKKILEIFSPDMIILTGLRPEIDCRAERMLSPEVPVISSEGIPCYINSPLHASKRLHTVYIVNKTGAFVRRI